MQTFFQYWIKNKNKRMPVVEPIREEDWMWFRFIFTPDVDFFSSSRINQKGSLDVVQRRIVFIYLIKMESLS